MQTRVAIILSSSDIYLLLITRYREPDLNSLIARSLARHRNGTLGAVAPRYLTHGAISPGPGPALAAATVPPKVPKLLLRPRNIILASLLPD